MGIKGQMELFLGENQEYLSQQVITYLGNKRALLDFIGTAVEEVKHDLGKDKIDIVDVFSGSGVVSRFFKQHANKLYSNDIEGYCEVINRCYLANRDEVNFGELQKNYDFVKNVIKQKGLRKGFIYELYSPVDDSCIKAGERVFYTGRNAMYIDTVRQILDEVIEPYRTFLLAPLLYEASVHNNTSGVFKGFYKNTKTGIGQFGGDGKNALTRILGNIEIKLPVFSNFSCDVQIYRQDANKLAMELPLHDLAYMDPPYNQHPYGSNYFMLNLINEYRRPVEISKVSGIPVGWNKSQYNKKQTAKDSMFDLCSKLKAKFLLISFNDDGFISKSEMVEMMSALGDVKVLDKEYNTFRGCRNLGDRDIHVKEFLYLVRKDVR